MSLTGSSTHSLVIVDDDDLFADQVAELLQNERPFSFMKARSASELLGHLATHQIECVLLDYDLGDDNGFRIAEEIREKVPNPPPMIMLTGGGGERTAVKAFRGGLFDYVTKRNLSVSELVQTIDKAISERRKARFHYNSDSEKTAEDDYDAPTGFYGKRFIVRYLKNLQENRRFGHGVFVVKIANYTEIAERFGPATNEQVFRSFVLKLRSAARRGDVWGRLSESSFVCISQSPVSPAEIDAFVARLQSHLSYDHPAGAITLQVAPSIGRSRMDGHESDPLAALRRASAQSKSFSAHLAPSFPAIVRGAQTNTEIDCDDYAQSVARRVFKRGHIIGIDEKIAIDCVVRKLSASAASLRFSDCFSLPQQMKLRIGADAYRLARLVSQSGCDADVAFVGQGAAG